MWESEIHAYDAWLATSGQSRGTRKLRRYYLERFASTVDGAGPWEVLLDDLVMFLANEDWSPETRKSARSALRGFYEWGVTTDRILKSPAVRLPSVRVPRTVPSPAPDIAVSRAIHDASERDRLMLLLGAYAGLRAGEIARLRWVDVGESELLVRGKGGRVRVVPIHSRIVPLLERERELRRRGKFGSGYRYGDPATPYLFPGQQGGSITPGAVGRILKRNLGGLKGHSLRHRFATTVHDATGNTLAVQQLLGHSRAETTSIYVRVSERALRDVVECA